MMATRSSPVATFGLTHLALRVKNPARAFRFYQRVFGMVAVYRERDFIQAQTPGARDVLVFERSATAGGRSGDIAHFGFRLTDPTTIARAIDSAKGAGGTLLEAGEFVPGEPYAFVRDLDGYTVEIWYELPTPVDPLPR
jgi:catechol 2,3-dioxygenase-like lactoylglutathione lyase family enzyme